MKRRMIFSDDGTVSDISVKLNDYYTGTSTLSIVAAEDKLFIGSPVPFNSFYVRMGATVNAETSAITIKLWDGSDFNEVAEVIDETSVSGATLAQSGFISFVPRKDEGWTREDTQDDSATELVTGLGDVNIYDQYWMEMTFSADLTADMILSWIGDIFSSDEELGSEFPDIVRTDTKAAFESGKTTWEEQHQVAAKILIKDLIRKHVLHDGNQILDREDLLLPSVQKVASIVYNALGDDFLDQYLASEKEYRIRLASAYVKTDRNQDGRLSVQERKPVLGRMFR